MNITADENIPYVTQAFTPIGKVKTLPGRMICSTDLLHTDILLVRSITQVNDELLKDSAIKFVASATSGINHIDLDFLNQNHIGFAHAKGSNSISVAQYVIAGICYWSLHNNKTLDQLSLGIIGYGNVGKQLEKLAENLGLNCVINDPPLSDLGQNKLQEIELAMNCDIVSLHVPLNKNGEHSTNYLINEENIHHLKPDGLFINTSRGGVVNENSLLAFKLKNPQFQIILDVWENEPNINLELLSQTLLATAHIAGYSFDGKLRGTEMIYHSCCQYFNINPKWSITVDEWLKHPIYNMKSAQHQDTRISVLEAYNLLQDSNNLRILLNTNGLKTGEYFDNLRKNYPIRREWTESL